MNNNRETWLQCLLFLALLTISAVFLLKPIYDNDFFWHLKTGEWIWQHGALPGYDPFNYTNPNPVPPAGKFTLTAYPLSQLMLYLTFLCSGMNGIVALRFVFAAILFVPVMKRLKADGFVNLSLMLLFMILVLNFYYLERPQTVSFICFAILLLVLERIKHAQTPETLWSGRWQTFCHICYLSFLMFFWANSHGGYLLGQITLLIFMIMEGIKCARKRLNPMPPERYLRLLVAGTCGITGSLINPNNIQALVLMLESRAGDSSAQILEYSSMLEVLSNPHSHVVILYLVLMAATVIVLLSAPGKLDVTEIVLLALVGYFAVKHVRYAAFFPIAALPVLGRHLATGMAARWGRRILPPVALVLAVYAVSGEFRTNIATAQKGYWINNRIFPVTAADFIIANDLRGNMYNQYDWGGYLIWRLAPERLVFCDGRNIDTNILAQSYRIDSAQVSADGERTWKTVLNNYGVNYTVTYSRSPEGELTPLVKAMLLDPEWVPVFSDRASRSVIFVRNIPRNFRIISLHRLHAVQ